MFPMSAGNLPIDYFNQAAIETRTAAIAQMEGMLQQNNLNGYRAAAHNFYSACAPGGGMHLPIQYYYVVLSPKKNLVNLYSGGNCDDGAIEVPGDGTVPQGNFTFTNPLPGYWNILEPTGQ